MTLPQDNFFLLNIGIDNFELQECARNFTFDQRITKLKKNEKLVNKIGNFLSILHNLTYSNNLGKKIQVNC